MALRPYGSQVLFYLAAAVSDFFIPWKDLVRSAGLAKCGWGMSMCTWGGLISQWLMSTVLLEWRSGR